MRHFLIPLLACACVVTPVNGTALGDQMDFEGFARFPNSEIALQVLNKATGQWETFGTAISASQPNTINGDSLHRWRVEDLDVTPGVTACYVNAECSGHEGRVSVRAVETSNGFELVTFDAGGVACVIDLLEEGKSWLAAGWTCKSPDYPVIELVSVG